MKIELLCNVKAGGKIYKAGYHDLPDEIAKGLISDGKAVAGEKPAERPVDPVKAQSGKKAKENKEAAEQQKKGGAK